MSLLFYRITALYGLMSWKDIKNTVTDNPLFTQTESQSFLFSMNRQSSPPTCFELG